MTSDSDLRSTWRNAGGEIPDDWDIVPFGSLLENDRAISVGVMYPGDTTVEGVPMIRVGDVVGGHLVVEPEFRIAEDVNEEHARTILKGDELLVTLVGSPGLCVVAEPRMAGWNVARALAVARLKNPDDRYFVKSVFA
ncbi:MAG: restriction endonuclease subunit S, partial [Blastocatellia bacterium]